MPVLARNVMAVAHRPVPHDRVSPQPRSLTRTVASPATSPSLARRCARTPRSGPTESRAHDRLGDQIKGLDVRQAGECVLKNGYDVRIAHVHERATCGTGRARNGHFVTVDVATLPARAHLHLEHVLAEVSNIAERSQDLHVGAGAEMEWRAARLVGDALLREQRDRTCRCRTSRPASRQRCGSP